MTVATAEREQGAELAQAEQWQRPPVSSALQQFASDGLAAINLARSLARTTFVPVGLKRRGSRANGYTYLEPEEVAYNVAACWLAGDEVGIKPMQSLQAINIIEGTPSLSALAMRALVQAAGHELWLHEASGVSTSDSTMSVTFRGRRKDSERVQEATYTLRMARQAGLLEKDNWQNNPLAMCTARASSIVCRLIAADVLLGLAYSTEELGDDPDLVAAQRETATMQRAPRPQAEDKSGDNGVPESGSSGSASAGIVPADSLPIRGDGGPGESQAEELDENNQERMTSGEPEEPGDVEGGSFGFVQAGEGECGVGRGDGAVCNRPSGHEGRHYYGRQGVGASAQPEPERPAGAEPGPAVGGYVPSPEERAAAEEGPEESEFPDVTDEELEAALEADRARLAEERAVVDAAERPPREVNAGPDSAVAPGEAVPLEGSMGETDDPWADFR